MSAALTVVRRIRDLFQAIPSDPPKRILFVKLVEQGATVVAEPAIRRAIEMVGRENVFMVVFRQNRFIIDVLGFIPKENVITIRIYARAAYTVGNLEAAIHLQSQAVELAGGDLKPRMAQSLEYYQACKGLRDTQFQFGAAPLPAEKATVNAGS